MNHHRHWCRT